MESANHSETMLPLDTILSNKKPMSRMGYFSERIWPMRFCRPQIIKYYKLLLLLLVTPQTLTVRPPLFFKIPPTWDLGHGKKYRARIHLEASSLLDNFHISKRYYAYKQKRKVSINITQIWILWYGIKPTGIIVTGILWR